MKRELIVHQDPKSPISEVFRTLRTNIQFMNTKGKLKTILVTSTLPGEGKSWVSSNLAVTFAQAGKKVVLVDADMRKGRQYSIFEVSPRPGLSNYLSGIDESNDETRLVDSTLIVTASKETKKEDLKRVIANIQQVGGKIAGVVVNKIPMNAKKYEQSYYYGSTSMSRTKNNNRTAQRSASRTTTKRQNREMYNRASNLMAQSGNRKISSKREIADIKQNQDMEANSKPYEQTDEIPTALQNKIKIENKEEISTEKTQEILNQINQYLDGEKKKMN